MANQNKRPKTTKKRIPYQKHNSFLSKLLTDSKMLTAAIFIFVFACLGAYMVIQSLAAVPNDYPRDRPTWDKMAPTLVQCESSNKPTIHNQTGKFHGLYQFDLPTWNGARPGISGHSDPHNAPRSEQDAVAYKLFTQRGLQPWPGKCGDQAYAAWKRSSGSAPNQTPTSGGGTSCESQTLRKGSRGDCVKYLQNKLNSFGYGLGVDGDFGSGTDSAVRRFQSSKGLTSDGVVGPNTWRALNSGSSPAPAPSGDPLPQGHVDGAGCDIYGWAFDRSDTNASIPVHFYASGNQFMGEAYADQARDDVNSHFGISGRHGFSFRVPDQFRDGATRRYDVYAINIADTSKHTLIFSGDRSCQ